MLPALARQTGSAESGLNLDQILAAMALRQGCQCTPQIGHSAGRPLTRLGRFASRLASFH
jgi:hypothetical protein